MQSTAYMNNSKTKLNDLIRSFFIYWQRIKMDWWQRSKLCCRKTKRLSFFCQFGQKFVKNRNSKFVVRSIEQLKFIMIKNKSWSYLIYWQRIKKDWRLRTKTQTLPSKIKKAFGGPGESAFLHWPETGPAVWPAGLCHWTQQQIILQCLTSWNVFNTRCCCCGQTCYRPLTCWRQVHTLAQRHSKHWTRTLIWFLGLIWNKNVIVRIWFKLHLPMEWLPLTCKQSVTTQALPASKYLK